MRAVEEEVEEVGWRDCSTVGAGQEAGPGSLGPPTVVEEEEMTDQLQRCSTSE